MTVGAHVRLVTISSDARDPNTFTHIYCEVEGPRGGGSRWTQRGAIPPLDVDRNTSTACGAGL